MGGKGLSLGIIEEACRKMRPGRSSLRGRNKFSKEGKVIMQNINNIS